MMRKLGWITSGVLTLAAFLLGFVPQYQKDRALQSQLGVARQQLNFRSEKTRMNELALLCGRAYLETSMKNYGLASGDSTKFFDGIQAMMNEEPDVSRQQFLQATLAQRDAVTGGLAKGDPGTLLAVQDLFQRVLQAAQSRSK